MQIYKFKCSRCNNIEDFIMAMSDYDLTHISELECPICKCKQCLNREYDRVTVIYKTTGFNATDSLIENKEMNNIMKSGG